MTDWMPIETAPRDGTRVWLWLADEEFGTTGAWRKVNEHEPDEPDMMWRLFEFDIWQTDNGLHEITHWQPLPEPPASP